MAGSLFGKRFTIHTWGESHGAAIGVIIDGCPSGLELTSSEIQDYLNRRKPGQSRYTTPRKESDEVQILSGLFEGKTTGTPISLLVPNTSQISKDYSEIAQCYRPGHADFGYDQKYGFRDYRGGGRSSARETIGRVAAGAIAKKILAEFNIDVCAYTRSIGPIQIDYSRFDKQNIVTLATAMPDQEASKEAEQYLDECMMQYDSVGGVVECVVTGCMPGLGEPVFDKLDANFSKALMSIGAVKAVEVGDGIAASALRGSQNNDSFHFDGKQIVKKTNHSGGILGGISDGSDIILRAHFKPTPSIFSKQETVNSSSENVTIAIKGRHDPIVVPRAVVVVEAMTCLTLLDALLENTTAKMEYLKNIYNQSDNDIC